jgi:site-specific DNA-methyltransferase (adenine-specific)
MQIQLPTADDPVTLIQGDALDVLRSLPDGCVDAVVTDPPWMDYETGRYDASGWHSLVRKVSPREYACGLFRVCREGAAILLWCRWDVFEEHSAALLVVGFHVRNCVVWAKPCHTAGDLEGNVGNRHEMAVFATKGRWERHGKRDVNLWDEPHLFSRDKRHHPTEKPLGLMRRSVRLTCPPGGVVLDPFAGSGSTLVAAMQEGRRAVGCEIEPAYCDIIRRRLAHASGTAPGSLFAGVAAWSD